MSRRRSIARVLFAAVPTMVVGTACYQYHPTPVSAIHNNDRVHVVLSTETSVALAATLGPNASTLDGRVVDLDGTRVRLALTQIQRVSGPEEFLHGDAIDVPRGGAVAVTVRAFDPLKTALAIGGIVGGAVVGRVILGQGGVSVIKGGPPGTTK